MARTDLRVLNSGNYPLAIWRNDNDLKVSFWNGLVWTDAETIDTDVFNFDVTQSADGGVHVLYRVGAVLHAGQFTGLHPEDGGYTFRSIVDTGATDPSGAVAVACDAGGQLGVVWQDSAGLYTAHYGADLAPVGSQVQLSSSGSDFDHGLSASFRGLRNEDGVYPLVIHAGQAAMAETGVSICEVASAIITQSFILYNSYLASHSFTVGDEVLAWCRTNNSHTNYLAAGVYKPVICGYADREEALEREVSAYNSYGISGVAPDPNSDDGSLFTWIRPYNAGAYSHPGNARLGDIDFLPELSTAAYGKSVYIAGSNCRNWDGKELGDAGFHDYPVGSDTEANGAGSKVAGLYNVRIYATRYNAMGEKMTGVAITSPDITLSGAQDTITISIDCIPCTNHDDVIFEVFCTTVNQGPYYLEATVANRRDAKSVSVDLVLSDAALADGTHVVDPHAPTVGGLTELEESAPLGCSVLVTASDRLWGIGGQVPQGQAQFSKLYEAGEGAGFDALAGTQTLDATGGVLTSISSFGDARVVAFQANQFYVVTDEGPNNYGQGSFGVPQLVVADGALNHAGTVVLPVGIGYWGDGGPRVLSPSFQVAVISEQVQPLTSTMTPSGVRNDKALREVVWYTRDGGAVLWNYANGSRWAEWSGLPVAGCSGRRLVSPTGRVLTPQSTPRDDGRRFEFAFATGNIRPANLLTGHTLVRAFGFTGEYLGSHRAKFKVYYNGSPLWSEKFLWSPETDSWLTAMTEMAALAPEDVDALNWLDRSGAYSTSKRFKREDCRYFKVEVSDCGDEGFTPWELAFELGMRAGFGRTAVNTFTR